MFLNSIEVAKKLGCTSRNVTLLVSKGKLKPVHKGKHYFLFDELEVINYLKLGGNENEQSI